MENKILVLGIGNLLMGDEGVGVHVIRHLEKEVLPDYVDLLDGGTGGFNILSVLESYPQLIMIDATMDEDALGTIKVVEPRYASDFPKVLSSHDIGLKDLVESAALLQHLPKITLITITISSLQDLTLDLSPAVEQSIPKVMQIIRDLLNTR